MSSTKLGQNNLKKYLVIAIVVLIAVGFGLVLAKNFLNSEALAKNGKSLIFKEARQWQMAADAPDIAVDAVSTATGFGTTITKSHTTSGTNRLMLVAVGGSGETVVLSGITYNAVPLTLVCTIGATYRKIWIYRLIAPASGTYNIVVTFSDAPDWGAVVGIMTFTGVDQTTPLGTSVAVSGYSTAASVTVSSASGELVFDTIADPYGITLTVGAGQTQRWNLNPGDGLTSAGSTEPGAASVVMSWTLAAEEEWHIGAVPIKPVSALPPTVSSVSLNNNSNINLTEGTTRLVTSTATVSDSNGYGDITSVIGRIYRSGVSNGANCSLNDNNCYQDSACATSSCSGTSCTATCSFNVWYHADPTVSGTPWNSDYWVAWIKAIDSQNASSSATNTTQTIEINDMVGMALIQPSGNLDFGTLIPGQDTGKINVTSTVAATGNCALDTNLSGQGLVKSGGTAMIDIQNQKYSTTTAPYDNYTTGGTTLTTSTVEFELELAKTTDHTATSTKKIFWGLAVPIGKETGTYYGTTTISAVKDELNWP